MRKRAGAMCALLICLLLAGCGAQQRQTRTGTTGARATDAQVLMLAQVLESDFRRGGAQFTANLQVDGQPARATGRVDFRSGRGTALVGPVDPSLGPPRRFFWTRTTVLAQASPGSRHYLREVPDEHGNPVHAMIGFINLLSAETIDNTANISAATPRLIGQTRIAGAPVDEFRYGRNGDITLWILTGSGLLRRIATTRASGGLTVDLINHDPIKIDLPRTARG